MVSTYRNGKVMSGLPTCSSKQIIPRGMCIGQAEPLNEGHLCVISDTSGCLDESQMNCSLMMSPELSANRETSYPNYSEIFWAFHETDNSTAEDECETQDFYW
ncbi:hypothetical protein TNCV_2399431 [Trichonephila clavipes]|uniref:Uncharacterized protein n=1 Tax=Trichonephila clavipes TaxID=2585209 RepID=A0A8X6SUY5_TRICX|nr:hypothetical protein TNCV_2399431 [Trichonephila clavipes]